jgi:hypothetical protein
MAHGFVADPKHRTTAQFTLRQSLRSFLGFVLRAPAQAKTHFALSRLLLSQNPRQAYGTQNVVNWKRCTTFFLDF